MRNEDLISWKQQEFKRNYAEALMECEALCGILISIMREGNGDADLDVVRARFEEANEHYSKAMELVEVLTSEMRKRLKNKKRGEWTFRQTVDDMNVNVLKAAGSRFMNHLQDAFGPFIREEQFFPKKGEEDPYDW